MSQSNESTETRSDEAFPVAEIKATSQLAAGRVLESKMWWITLTCLGVAIYLAWSTLRPTGVGIVIDFPEGHGLKVGDGVRHRGIDVGIVTSIELAPDLHSVRAQVELEQSAAGIANAESKFWIVRPQLSLTNIRGLETAVGSKYIAVHPGPADDSPPAWEFAGLKDPPAVAVDDEGIEILLRGEESYGINPGSPVTYRGIRVGHIQSVDLGRNALAVTVRAHIRKRFQPLLRRGSKFWKTSGVDVDFGLKGFHLSTDSLSALARGGVSFVTPKTRNESDLEPIESGHEYELLEKVDDDWLRDAAAIEIVSSYP